MKLSLSLVLKFEYFRGDGIVSNIRRKLIQT